MAKLARSVNVPDQNTQNESGNGFVVDSTAGTITLTFDTGDVMRGLVQGDSYYFPNSEYTRVKVESSVPGEIVGLTLGYFQKFQVGGASSSVVVISPLNPAGEVSVGGPVAYGTSGPLATFDDPIELAMLYDLGGANFQAVPPRSYDGESLAVQPGKSLVPGFIWAAGQSLSTKGYAVAKVQVSTAPSSGKVQFLDEYNNPLPVYDADTGTNVGATGGIAAANTSGFYVPLSGTNNITITAVNGGIWLTLGMVPFTPIK